jgi:prenyl protein peptidase
LLGLPDSLLAWLSVSTLKHLAITPLLFAGPLYAQLLSQRLPGMRNWSYKEDVEDVFFAWMGIRNFFVVSII